MAGLADQEDYGWGPTYPGSMQPGTQQGSQADGQGAGLTPLSPLGQPYGAAAPISPWKPSTWQRDATPEQQPDAGAGVAGTASPAVPTGMQRTPATSEQGDPAQKAIAGYQSQVSAIQGALDPASRASMVDSLARDIYTNLKGAGHDVKWEGEQLLIDGRPYVVAGGQSWMPTGESGYTPGDIGMEDVPNFSYDQLMQQMATPEEDAFIANLLANPHSLDDRTVATMKAKSKDELAEMELQNQDRLKSLGTSYGIQESPWLASEQVAGQRATDRALVGSNREIDLQRAERDRSDELGALSASMQHSEGKRARVAQATSAALSSAAARGDRMALRESVNQAAAQLNMQAQDLLASHVGQQLDRVLQNLQFDKETETRLKISAQELAHGDMQHLETLAMELQRLQMMDEQFAAQHGLNMAQFGEQKRHNLASEDLDWARLEG